MSSRNFEAARFRNMLAAELQRDPSPTHGTNGEEGDYPFIANFSKGLPHDDVGEVLPDAYARLLRAVATGQPEDFEAIPQGPAGKRRLTNPQSGLAFDTEGPDGQSLVLPPAPRIDSAQNSAEMVELYWMSLLRDLPFSDYSKSTVGEAVDELTRLSDFRGPKQSGKVTAGTLFRGNTLGDLRGPYVSQFLLLDIPYGVLRIPQVTAAAPKGMDYVTKFEEWLAVQNAKEFPKVDPGTFPDRHYVHTPRDLATYVHFDALYEAYLNACLILLGMGAKLDPGNPYLYSRNQEGFGTYGDPHILSLVTEVATRALKAVWFQKWIVHRRLRPEEFGGRIHVHKTGKRDYPQIDSEVLESVAVKKVFEKNGSYLLPQAFPEGSPTHPAYGAGHATVAGACVTILKAWFDESFVIPKPTVPSPEGSKLIPYDGPDHDKLTLGGELNKLASNIAIGRNMGGVHWRTDYSESVRLGEQIGIRVLRDHLRSTHEEAGFSITLFDGTRITVTS